MKTRTSIIRGLAANQLPIYGASSSLAGSLTELGFCSHLIQPLTAACCFIERFAERVKTLAPFLKFDADPYVVLVDGNLYWIIDAYTTSTYYPYSAQFSATELNANKQPGNVNAGWLTDQKHRWRAPTTCVTL